MITNTVQACPECEAPVHVGDSVRLNEILECGGCRSELEIVALQPTVLALAPDVEEDWGE
jgi:alpha-aminoadipate carrier protein LysW